MKVYLFFFCSLVLHVRSAIATAETSFIALITYPHIS
jgi:hypothetical protein